MWSEPPTMALMQWATSPGFSWAGVRSWTAVWTLPTFAKNFQAGSRSDLVPSGQTLCPVLPKPVLGFVVTCSAPACSSGSYTLSSRPLSLGPAWPCECASNVCSPPRGTSGGVWVHRFPPGQFLAVSWLLSFYFLGH